LLPFIILKNLTGFKKDLAAILTAQFESYDFLHYGISSEDDQHMGLQS
jgi:hypothetical protein